MAKTSREEMWLQMLTGSYPGSTACAGCGGCFRLRLGASSVTLRSRGPAASSCGRSRTAVAAEPPALQVVHPRGRKEPRGCRDRDLPPLRRRPRIDGARRAPVACRTSPGFLSRFYGTAAKVARQSGRHRRQVRRRRSGRPFHPRFRGCAPCCGCDRGGTRPPRGGRQRRRFSPGFRSAWRCTPGGPSSAPLERATVTSRL